MARPTLRTEQRFFGAPAGQQQPHAEPQSAVEAASKDRNAQSGRTNGMLDISQGTSVIHPNTGIRKAHSVGCTQSMEHSSGMWYDGRELNSGTLEHLDFEPVESPCGEEGSLYMCYYGGELYADSEAVYSDEDEAIYDDEDEDIGVVDEDDDEDDEDDDESPDEPLYMRYCPDSKKGPAVVEHALATGDDLDITKVSFEQYSKMSSPVDPRDLHGRLMLVQGQDYSS